MRIVHFCREVATGKREQKEFARRSKEEKGRSTIQLSWTVMADAMMQVSTTRVIKAGEGQTGMRLRKLMGAEGAGRMEAILIAMLSICCDVAPMLRGDLTTSTSWCLARSLPNSCLA